MDPQFTEVSQVFERFKAAFLRKDFETCNKLLSQLKVSFITYKGRFGNPKHSSFVLSVSLSCYSIWDFSILMSIWGFFWGVGWGGVEEIVGEDD